MRRVPIPTLLVVGLFMGVPASALAHRHHGAHATRHHSRHHHARGARVEHLTAPSSPTPSNEPSAGAATVVSFEGGVLTLELPNHTTVQGAVTEDTRISCSGTEAGSGGEDTGDGGGAGEWHGEGSDGSRPVQPPGSSEVAHASWRGGNDGGDDEGADDDGQEGHTSSSCGTASLVHGAIVRAAELRIGATGSAFEEIDLAG
jgi:hypothetical protein